MGYRSGIYIKEKPSTVAEGLSGRLNRYGFTTRQTGRRNESPGTGAESEIHLSSWARGWSIIHVDHEDPNSRIILDSITIDEPFASVVHCRYEPDMHEYSYSYFQDGTAMEVFSCVGMAMPALDFISELRKVPLHTIVEGRKFMVESLKNLGVEPLTQPVNQGSTVSMVLVPPRNSILKKLLGALWSGG